MTQILSLSPEDERRLHSHALKRFTDWQNRILSKVPQLRQLSAEQVRALLRDNLRENELTQFNRCITTITEWLAKCIDTGNRYLPVAYAEWIIDPMSTAESLLSKACERAAAERRKEEYEERWCALYVSMHPPDDDAKEYLNDTEQREFLIVTGRAIDACLQDGRAYVTDARILEYDWWLNKIQKRKRKKAQRLAAIDAARKYNHRVHQEIVTLASMLATKPKDLMECFRTEIKDTRCTNHDFDYVLSGDDEMNLDRVLVSEANRRLEQLLSDDLRSFIDIPSQYYRLYFALPLASYRHEKAPCIDIGFHVFAAAYAEVWLKPANRIINGYEFTLPVMQEGDNQFPLKKPRLLAYHHVFLTPEELGGQLFWRSIPLILFQGLLRGETSPDGCTISAASASVTTYRVRGFDEEIQVPDGFAEYLSQIGTVDEMVAMGIMTKKVGALVQAMPGGLEVKGESQQLLEKTPKRDSMKERAFRLFDDGKRPSDPEVKAVGIKPNSAYRYYQAWKRASNH